MDLELTNEIAGLYPAIDQSLMLSQHSNNVINVFEVQYAFLRYNRAFDGPRINQ